MVDRHEPRRRDEKQKDEKQKDHKARPQQVGHGWEEGFRTQPQTPEDARIGRFSEGQERNTDPAEHEPRDRFSRGLEADEDDMTAERRFSEGLEKQPRKSDPET